MYLHGTYGPEGRRLVTGMQEVPFDGKIPVRRRKLILWLLWQEEFIWHSSGAEDLPRKPMLW